MKSAPREALSDQSTINYQPSTITFLPKKHRYRLEYAGVCFLAWAIPKLSRRACVRLARALGHMAVGFSGHGGFGVQETFKNPLLTDLFTRLRGVAGNTVVEQDRSVLRFFKHLKKGGTAGLLIDLTLRPTQPSAVIESFGMKT